MSTPSTIAEPSSKNALAFYGGADESGIAIILTWMFASILGALMKEGGLVEGIIWLGTFSGVDQNAFTLATYISAMLFTVGTGTSNGTAIALVPVLYPAGIAFYNPYSWTILAVILFSAYTGWNRRLVSEKAS